jgi:hypothetical protein
MYEIARWAEGVRLGVAAATRSLLMAGCAAGDGPRADRPPPSLSAAQRALAHAACLRYHHIVEDTQQIVDHPNRNYSTLLTYRGWLSQARQPHALTIPAASGLQEPIDETIIVLGALKDRAAAEYNQGQPFNVGPELKAFTAADDAVGEACSRVS